VAVDDLHLYELRLQGYHRALKDEPMTTTSERLIQTAQSLPESLLVEVLDFADFLRTKQMKTAKQSANISLASLCGGLENTQTFVGSPLATQQQLRDEWR